MNRPNPCDHLMIVYYDILLLDDVSYLTARHSERFKQLEKVVSCSKGLAELVSRQLIDFGSRSGASRLRLAFAAAILAKEEGLVVKQDAPYFNFNDSSKRNAGLCIKLKKEYIGNFGEVGDFAVVGAGYDAAKAKSYNFPGVRWTHFFIGCLENRDAVKQWKVKPFFKIVNCVELSEILMKTFVLHGNPLPVPRWENDMTELELPPGISSQSPVPLSVAFRNPLVFDMRCFSFEDLGNTGFFSMRFPTVSKLHFDRDFTDTISFSELQELAAEAQRLPDLEDSQENLEWIARLEAADPRGRAVDALSQLTATTAPTPSPRKSTQPRSETPESPVVTRRPFSVSRNTFGSLPRPPSALLPIIEPSSQLSNPPMACETRSVPCGTPLPKRTLSVIPSPRKRQRSCQLVSADQAFSDRQSQKLQERNPLEEIHANISQKSSHELVNLVEDSRCTTRSEKLVSVKQLGRFNVATRDEPDLNHNSAGVNLGSTNTISDDESKSLPIEIIDLEEEEFLDDQKSELRVSSVSFVSSKVAHGGKANTASVAILEQHITVINKPMAKSCSFLGANCFFSGRRFLMAPYLTPETPKLVELLQQHGAQPIFDVKDLIQREVEKIKDGQKVSRHEKAILIVDTQEYKDATDDLLKWADGIRNTIPDELRDWIYVCDWRVLLALTDLEDPKVASSSNESFEVSMRWYCGLI